jgi:hypothetical protein
MRDSPSEFRMKRKRSPNEQVGKCNHKDAQALARKRSFKTTAVRCVMVFCLDSKTIYRRGKARRCQQSHSFTNRFT